MLPVTRSFVCKAPLQPTQFLVSVLDDANDEEVIPLAQLSSAMVAPHVLTRERLVAAASPYVRADHYVRISDLPAILAHLGDAYALTDCRAILDQFAAPAAAAPVVDDCGDDSNPALVGTPTAATATSAARLRDSLEEAELEEAFYEAGVRLARCRKRRLRKELEEVEEEGGEK
jgi:hypothetical protein